VGAQQFYGARFLCAFREIRFEAPTDLALRLLPRIDYWVALLAALTAATDPTLVETANVVVARLVARQPVFSIALVCEPVSSVSGRSEHATGISPNNTTANFRLRVMCSLSLGAKKKVQRSTQRIIRRNRGQRAKDSETNFGRTTTAVICARHT
jgi:hypothetical protein